MNFAPANPLPDIAFVACIEAGPLQVQTLRLFDSLRRFGGRLRGCPAYAVSPRPGRPIDAATRTALQALGVVHIEEHLNRDCAEYGSANRVAAAAYVEANFAHEILVVLDSDTLFLREPTGFLLDASVDAVVRPVDVQGMCSSGADDARDGYWRELCALSGIDYDLIPWTHSTVDNVRVRASYNGGLVVVRRRLGMLQRWADIFFSSARAGLVPQPDAGRFQAGAGWVEPVAGRWWGSNQAALSLALWSTTDRVLELPATYNYPLHMHARMEGRASAREHDEWVHVHYHWLFQHDGGHNPLLHESRPSSPEVRRWLDGEVEAAPSLGHPPHKAELLPATG